MDIFLAQFVNALSYAFLLFLLASGMALIFGTMGIINIAHGGLYVLGAYVGLTVFRYLDNFWLSALLAAVALGLVGLMLERVFLSRLYKLFAEQVLVTIGIAYIITNTALWVWGPLTWLGTKPAILSGSLSIGGFTLPAYRFGVILIGLVLYIVLWWLQDKTRIGARIRAGMDDKETTTGLGINYGLMATAIFTVGTMMGGLAGFIGAPIIGVNPELGIRILLLAFIVVIVGGVGSVHGTLLGSLTIGLIDNLGKAYFPDLAMFTIYLVFIIVLVVRPSGILGMKQV